ncbi:MAG: ABC transporter ATP-binding protein [Candidatus Berkiella sp.]
MTKQALLSIQNICARFGAIQALHDVSLNVYEKEIVSLIGANGAGKTTLLMSVYAQPPIKSGKILFQDTPIHHLKTHEISKLGIAISPERRRIFPKMTTTENLMMGAYLLDKTKIKDNLDKVYHLFPILKERKNQRAGTLSGGEQQMLAMGRSLMSSPKLFLLDEPSLGLAPVIVSQVFKVLKEIANLGTTILLVEQNAHIALKLAHRGYVLMNGKITLEGSGQDLLNNPQVQSAYLGTDL